LMTLMKILCLNQYLMNLKKVKLRNKSKTA
jgi:hypothetical protein